jgi:carbon storage regulator
MLILSRREGQSFTIGDGVTVTVVAIKGRQVRIGISAPKNVPVLREELARRIRCEQKGDVADKSKSVTDYASA